MAGAVPAEREQDVLAMGEKKRGFHDENGDLWIRCVVWLVCDCPEDCHG